MTSLRSLVPVRNVIDLQVEVGGLDCVSAASTDGDRAAINADATEITCSVPAESADAVKAGKNQIRMSNKQKYIPRGLGALLYLTETSSWR